MKVSAFFSKHRYKLTFGFIAFFLLAFPVGSYVVIQGYFLPKIRVTDHKLRSYLPQVIADLQYLERHPIFSEMTYDRNAEDLLSAHIRWQGDSVEFEPADNALADKVIKFIEGWPANPQLLTEVVKTADFKKLNTDWLEKIHKYDHWNITENELLQSEMLRAQKHSNPLARLGVYSQTPIPDLLLTANLGVLHFLKMQQKGRPTQGLRTYRKLAELIFSSHSLLSHMVTHSILRRERLLSEIYGIKSWSPVPEKSADAFKRVGWAFNRYITNASLNGFPKELIYYARPENGICSAATEYMYGVPLVVSYLEESQAPFEVSFSGSIRQIGELHSQWIEDCGIGKIIPAERIPASVALKPKGQTGLSYWDALSLPYVRRIAGVYLMHIGTGDKMLGYDELQTE